MNDSLKRFIMKHGREVGEGATLSFGLNYWFPEKDQPTRTEWRVVINIPLGFTKFEIDQSKGHWNDDGSENNMPVPHVLVFQMYWRKRNAEFFRLSSLPIFIWDYWFLWWAVR